MIIGFSTGCLYKKYDVLSPKTIDFFRKAGCNAIELMVHDSYNRHQLKKLKESDLQGFEYISAHAPLFKKEELDEYIKALEVFTDIHAKIKLDSVVLHPDMIEDFDFLKKFQLPYFVENMDNRKKSCKNVEDLQIVFEKFDVPMILDVNHCFSNDPTMKLAHDLVKAFGNRIKGYHLSGFTAFHEPLFMTKQTKIIDAIPDTSLPIIIESILNSPKDISTELEYIKAHLQRG